MDEIEKIFKESNEFTIELYSQFKSLGYFETHNSRSLLHGALCILLANMMVEYFNDPKDILNTTIKLISELVNEQKKTRRVK